MPIGINKLARNSQISDSGGSAIPDSEADQKLLHRWTYGSTDPFKDQIGSFDATNNGTTEVAGSWVGDAARSGDGSSQYVDHTTLGDFGSTTRSTDFAIGLSFATSDTGDLLGNINGNNNNNGLFIGTRGHEKTSRNTLSVGGRDAANNGIGLETDTTVTDGVEYRIVWNKIGNDATNWEIWLNQAEESTTTGNNSTWSTFDDFSLSLYAFARNFDGSVGSPLNGVIDDICIFNDSLTQTEIKSYNNPWQ